MMSALLVAMAAGACAAQGSEFLALSNSDLLHYPETGHQKLSDYDVSNILARMLHVSPPSEHVTKGLPVVDLFHGPKVVLMLSVEGAADSEVGHLDNIAKLAKKSKVYDMDSNFATPALSTLKILSGGDRTTRVTDNLRSNALKICASSDEFVSMACGPTFTNLRWNSEERTFASRQIPLDLSPERLYNASFFWTEVGSVGTLDTRSAKFVAKGDGEPTELDLNEEVVNKFFSELSLFAALPGMLAQGHQFRDEVPDFAYLSLAGLKNIGAHYGTKSLEFVLAAKVLDVAVPTIMAQWRAAVGKGLQEILYLKKTGTIVAEASAHATAARRKLLATTGGGSTSTRTVYSLSDIATYQIVLWMSILGVVIVFAASVALGNMSFEEDDAGLYSAFKATEDYGEMRHGHVHDE